MTEDTESVQVSLPQILDLALGTPEVGSVNFNILHNFLHVLLHQLNLTNKNVEYRGDNANRIKTALGLLTAGSNPVLQAHNVTENEGNNVNAENAIDTPSIPTDDPTTTLSHEQTVPSAEPSEVPLATTGNVPSTVPSKTSSAIPSARPSRGPSAVPLARSSATSATPIPPSIPSARPSVILPNLPEEITRLNDRLTEVEANILYLNDDMAELQNHVGIERESTTVPSISSKEIISPDISQQPADDKKLSEQIIPIPEDTTTSPIFPAKESRNEISSSRRSTSISNGRSIIAGVDLIQLKENIVELQGEMAVVKKNIEMIQSEMDQKNIRPDQEHSADNIMTETEMDNIAPVNGDDVYLNEPEFSGAKDNVNAPVDQGSVSPQNSQDTPTIAPPTLPTTSSTTLPMNEQADGIHSSSRVIATDDTVAPEANGHVDNNSDDTERRKSKSQLIVSTDRKSQEAIDDKNEGGVDADGKKIELTETVENMEIIYSEAVRNLESRVAELESEMKMLNETISNMQLGSSEGIHEIQDFAKKMQDFHADIEKVNKTAARFAEEKEKGESNTNIIIEQIELLKTIKADKEELEDALADKADAGAVNKKVSYDRFNTACDDLARGVEDTITKLTRQEYVWQQSLEAVQQEIDNKLDKGEISPIREFVNNRLQLLQDKIKELAEEKRDNEAAGTRKILTGLHCISCDKKAVMKIEQGPNYNHNTGPFARNIKPYSSCEIDSMKKQQKKYLGKNMNQFNAAMQEMGKKLKPPSQGEVIDKISRDHLCNRYCGGSHTVTTPQQRIMRMGHFLAQWGPEAVELTSGVVRGTDGQLYHSTSMPPGASAANHPNVCGPSMQTMNATCCGMQNSNLSNQQSQQKFQGAELQSTTQRRISQKEPRRGESSTLQSARRLSSKKIAEISKNDRPVQIILDNSMASPSALSTQQNIINDDKYFNAAPGQIDDGIHKMPSGTI